MSGEAIKDIINGKNARNVKCKYCNSIILKPETAIFIEHQFDLPKITQNVKDTSPTTESVSTFWLVDDMFTFHNVGFSNTVDTTKYLACADCDAGPIGYHDLSTKKSYVALSRVEYSCLV